jgi:ribonuclease Z
MDLVRGADILFIEAMFLDAESDRAAVRHHLTARQAGEVAGRAGVRRVVPFHFSPRYCGREDVLIQEVTQAHADFLSRHDWGEDRYAPPRAGRDSARQ